MYAVILHPSNRIDADDLTARVARDCAVFKLGGKPSPYVVLAYGLTQREALDTAAELRGAQRSREQLAKDDRAV